MTTTADFVRQWATERPDHVALRWGDRQMTYAELDQRSSRVAQALRASGVGAGERVAYLDKNSPEQIELFFGAAKLNAVPTPVNFRLAPPEVAGIVADSEAKVFAVGAEFEPLLDKIAGDLPDVQFVIIGGEEAADGAQAPSPQPFAVQPFDVWRDSQPAEDPKEAQGPDDVAYQLYSSGTTGRPKGVQLTNSNFSAGLALYPELLEFGPESVSMVAMPLFHIGGGGWALAGLAVGVTNVLVRDIDPTELVGLIEREKITHAFLVPAVLQFMLAVPGVRERDFTNLKCFLYGASPISEQVLAESIRTFRCKFLQAYGLTETTGTVVL
ncbi:MAG: long-chain fatty acid--CoA ligase, partial [Candidatus Aeolococcus gillhamiae]